MVQRLTLVPDFGVVIFIRGNSKFVRSSVLGFRRGGHCNALAYLDRAFGMALLGVAITKFSGHAVIFRSSPTVFADTSTALSTSTTILLGNRPAAVWGAAVLLGLYRIGAPLRDRLRARIAYVPAVLLLTTYGGVILIVFRWLSRPSSFAAHPGRGEFEESSIC